jgi:hypothetical protein
MAFSVPTKRKNDMSTDLSFFNVFFVHTPTKVQKHVVTIHTTTTHSCNRHTQVVTNCTHTHVYTHAHMHTRTHARTHTHPHTHPYIHTNTHTHLSKPLTDTHCYNTQTTNQHAHPHQRLPNIRCKRGYMLTATLVLHTATLTATVIYAWVVSHLWTSHVTNEWGISHMNASPPI